MYLIQEYVVNYSRKEHITENLKSQSYKTQENLVLREFLSFKEK